MMTLRRAEQRYHDRLKQQEVWLSFYAAGLPGPVLSGFGNLESLNEHRLPPGAPVPRYVARDGEVITYVREGALAYRDSTGRSGVIQAGEFQQRTAARGCRHQETNASQSDWAQVFQVWLEPSEVGRAPDNTLKRFSAAERRGELCIVASPDGQKGSLRLHQDVVVQSAILESGRHVVRELLSGRCAWLHVIQGEVTLGDLVLASGDGAGILEERVVSLTAREESEILLLDLKQAPALGGGDDQTPGLGR